jgi:tyrosinase
MKYAFFALALVAAGTLSVNAQCTSPTIRKEIRDLTAAERKIYFSTLRKATTGSNSIINKLAHTHTLNNDVIHAGPNFLVWHRLFIRVLEQTLQKIEPRFALHYWDWTKDYRAPETSAVLTKSCFGGNTRGKCLSTTYFKPIARSPTRACLSRDFAGGNTPGVFYNRAITNRIRDYYTTYDEYRAALESGPHAAPHNLMGGQMSTMSSPEDPLFFAHHSFIDYQYVDWQLVDYETRKWDYGGVNQDGSPATLDDPLVGLNAYVGDAIDFTNLCYDYLPTGKPKSMGSENFLPWRIEDQIAAAQAQQNQQFLVRRNYAAVRPAAAAPAAAAKPTYQAPKPAYQAPANATAPYKVRPLPPLTDEEAECIAKEYDEELAHPTPIDEKWLKMMGHCVETQRALEKSYCDFVDKVNTKIKDRCEAY